MTVLFIVQFNLGFTIEQSSNAVTNQVKNDTVVELNLPTKNTTGDTQLFGQQDSLF